MPNDFKSLSPNDQYLSLTQTSITTPFGGPNEELMQNLEHYIQTQKSHQSRMSTIIITELYVLSVWCHKDRAEEILKLFPEELSTVPIPIIVDKYIRQCPTYKEKYPDITCPDKVLLSDISYMLERKDNSQQHFFDHLSSFVPSMNFIIQKFPPQEVIDFISKEKSKIPVFEPPFYMLQSLIKNKDLFHAFLDNGLIQKKSLTFNNNVLLSAILSSNPPSPSLNIKESSEYRILLEVYKMFPLHNLVDEGLSKNPHMLDTLVTDNIDLGNDIVEYLGRKIKNKKIQQNLPSVCALELRQKIGKSVSKKSIFNRQSQQDQKKSQKKKM